MSLFLSLSLSLSFFNILVSIKGLLFILNFVLKPNLFLFFPFFIFINGSFFFKDKDFNFELFSGFIRYLLDKIL